MTALRVIFLLPICFYRDSFPALSFIFLNFSFVYPFPSQAPSSLTLPPTIPAQLTPLEFLSIHLFMFCVCVAKKLSHILETLTSQLLVRYFTLALRLRFNYFFKSLFSFLLDKRTSIVILLGCAFNCQVSKTILKSRLKSRQFMTNSVFASYV